MAAAVAAGLPVGGGVTDAGRFGLQSELGNGEEEWQVGGKFVWGFHEERRVCLIVGGSMAGA